jgi:hypothetical protein
LQPVPLCRLRATRQTRNESSSAAFATPAWAAKFFIVQNVKTKRCTIVDRKPVVTTETVIVGNGKVYTTRAEAETGLKTVKICTTN